MKSKAMTEPRIWRCSFCWKCSSEVGMMVAGSAANICNECIALCQELVTNLDSEAAKAAVIQEATP